jgi:hypothetical protein
MPSRRNSARTTPILLQTTTIHAASEGGVSVGRENSGADVSLAASGPNNRKRKKYYKKEQFSLLPLHHAYQAFNDKVREICDSARGQVGDINAKAGGRLEKVDLFLDGLDVFKDFLFEKSYESCASIKEFKSQVILKTPEKFAGNKLFALLPFEPVSASAIAFVPRPGNNMLSVLNEEEDDDEGGEEGDGEEEEVRIITNKRARV